MSVKLPNEFEQLVGHFAKLPSIGEKTAQRLVLSLMKWDEEQIQKFSSSLRGVQNIKKCSLCGIFCTDDKCDICQDQSRIASGIICVVESITDFLAVEKSGYFKGIYHLLGGVINPLMGVGPEDLRIDLLQERIKSNNISEVILALNPSVEGDVTCAYIKQEFSDDLKIHRIGFGVPMGSNIEYMDPLTISKAMEFRRTF